MIGRQKVNIVRETFDVTKIDGAAERLDRHSDRSVPASTATLEQIEAREINRAIGTGRLNYVAQTITAQIVRGGRHVDIRSGTGNQAGRFQCFDTRRVNDASIVDTQPKRMRVR